MSALLSDEVWARLDPHEGRLTRRTALRLWLTIGAAMLVASAGFAAWWAGLVTPRVAWPGSSAYGMDVETRGTFRYHLLVANEGLTDVTVTGVGRSGPGLRLTGTSGAGVTLGPGAQSIIVLEYEVTDCAAVPTGAWPVPVQVTWLWGDRTVDVQPDTHLSADAPDSFSYTGDRSPYDVEWQRAAADMACGYSND
ncbi:hypothetical protein GCM10009682_60180 [Luedemannella flava]|uniref:Uncharacterized protein n=1 Tax=Luedemannella flava TaxID=349316 RepID=A0ABN2MQA2_9ACTN